MALDESQLKQIVTKTAEEHDVNSVAIPLDSIERVGESISCRVEWVFGQTVPELPYTDGVESLSFSDFDMEVRFESTTGDEVRSTDPYAIIYQRNKTHFDRLEQVLSEIRLDVGQLAAFVNRDEFRVDYVSIRSGVQGDKKAVSASQATYHDFELSDHLHLRISFSTPHTHEVDGISTNHRFAHVSELQAGEHAVPVVVETSHFPTEDEPQVPGQWVHASEYIAENTKARNLSIKEELGKIDLVELLHSDKIHPDGPRTWDSKLNGPP